MTPSVPRAIVQDPEQALRELVVARERLREMRHALDVAEAAMRRLTLGDDAPLVAGLITSATPDLRTLRAHYDDIEALVIAGTRVLESAGVRLPVASDDISAAGSRPADGPR